MFLQHTFDRDIYGEIYPMLGVPVSNPRSALSAMLSAALDSYPIAQAREALALVDQAREALGTRTDARATAARELLEAKRAPIAIGVEAYESLGASLDGPAASEVLAAIAQVRSETIAAEQAYALASREDALARLGDLEGAKAAARQLYREMCELRQALRAPKFDPAPFERARASTVALAARPKRPNANDQFAALQQGRVADQTEAILWACWEPESHALISLRWDAYSARETAA